MSIIKKLPQELKLITPEEYRKHIAHRKTITHRKFHESIYIAPDGRIIDCRYPDETQSHLTTSRIFYYLIDTLSKTDMYKSLNLDESFAYPIPQGQTPEETVDKTLKQITNKLKESSGLDFSIVDPNNPEFNLTQKASTLLSQEDCLVQDLGFVKIMIMTVGGKQLLAVEVPSKLFKDRKVTSKQMDTINQIENMVENFTIASTVEEKELEVKKLYRDAQIFLCKKHSQ